MKRIVLFEDAAFANLLPLTYWRTVFDLRCGGFSLAHRMATMAGSLPSGLWTRAWIADVAAQRWALPVNQPVVAGDTLVSGRWLAEQPVTFHRPPFVATCSGAIAYVSCDRELASRLGPEDFLDRTRWSDLVASVPNGPVSGTMIQYAWDLLEKNADFIVLDTDTCDAAMDQQVHPSAVLKNRNAIRLKRGVCIEPMALIDATEGPVILDEEVTVRSQACIYGPAHIGAASVIHPHAFIHGGTSIGPMCKVGGEINACIIQGYTNKAHQGFLGQAYVGSWVNIGAGTSNSNLKNTYGTVRVPINGQEVDTGATFFGCLIGDHAKVGIQQAISTGSVIGFAANVASSTILPRFVRSFTWLTDRGVEVGDAARLAETAATVMDRRKMTLTKTEKCLFEKLPEIVAYFEPELATRRPDQEAVSLAADAMPIPMPHYGHP